MPRFDQIQKRLAGKSWGGSPGPYAGYGGYGILGGTVPVRLPSSRMDWEAEAGDLTLNSAVAAGLGWLQDNFVSSALTVERVDPPGVAKAQPVDHPLLKLLGPGG